MRPTGANSPSGLSKNPPCYDLDSPDGFVGFTFRLAGSARSTLDYYREQLLRLGWAPPSNIKHWKESQGDGNDAPSTKEAYEIDTHKQIAGWRAQLNIQVDMPNGTPVDASAMQTVSVTLYVPPTSGC